MTSNVFLESALKSTALWTAAWGIVRSTKRSSAAVRHLLWTLSFLAALILPIVVLLGPAWHVVSLPSPLAPNAVVRAPGVISPRTIHSASIDPPAFVKVAEAEPTRFSLRNASAFWLVIVLWLGGLSLIVLKLVVGLLWSSRIVFRATALSNPDWKLIHDDVASVLHLSRQVRILKSEETSVPSTLGILRSRILVPLDAESWAPQRIRMVLLHELAHVKRNDCGSQMLARLSCAVHWFNPLAWIAMARMTVEQERACDDLVLASGASAQDYADELISFARASRLKRFPEWVTLAMASRSDFGERVVAILDDKRSRYLPSRTQSIAVCLTVAAATFTIGVTSTAAHVISTPPHTVVTETPAPILEPPKVVPMKIQSVPAPKPAVETLPPERTEQPLTFETATIKQWERVGPGPYFGGGGCHGVDAANSARGPIDVPLGRCRFTNSSLANLIGIAFHTTIRSYVPPDQMIEQLPDWAVGIRSDRWDVEGKAEDPATTTTSQLVQMLRALVVERTALMFHLETRELQGFVLTIAKSGSKLVEAGDVDPAAERAASQAGAFVTPKASMEALTTFLSTRLRVPIKDETGLTGTYAISLKWTPGDNEFSGASGPDGPLPATFVPRGMAPADPNGASLFTAIQDQLGLRLQSQKVASQIIVIDHLTPPTPN